MVVRARRPASMVRYFSSSRVPSPGVRHDRQVDAAAPRHDPRQGGRDQGQRAHQLGAARRELDRDRTTHRVAEQVHRVAVPLLLAPGRRAARPVRRGDQSPSRGGGDQPKPGRSTATPSTRSRSRAIRSVQFVDGAAEPVHEQRRLGGRRVGRRGAADRQRSPATCTSLRGQSTGRSASRSSRVRGTAGGVMAASSRVLARLPTRCTGAPYRCCAHEGGELLVEPSFDGREEGAGHRLALESGEAAGGPPAADDQQLVHLG